MINIQEAITRVRRSTRNTDVLAICDEVDRLQAELRKLQPKPKRDRKTYMRDYMANRRRVAKLEREKAAAP